MHGIVGDGTLLLSVGVIVWLGSWAASVRVARAKGLNTLLWGAAGFVFGPLAVLFLAFAGPSENAPASNDMASPSDVGKKPND
jgi:hypothetical protein